MTLKFIVLLVCLNMIVASCSDDNATTRQPNTENTIAVAPNTDLLQLKSVTSIPAQPQRVWWNRTKMGENTTDSVPGPTDIQLVAWLDYGSAEAVAKLVADKRSSVDVRLVPATWLPESLIRAIDGDGRINAKQYKDVSGFHPNARIYIPSAMPSYIILSQTMG